MLMTEDFPDQVRTTLSAAREHAIRLRELPKDEHRRLCETLATNVTAVFQQAESASQGFLSFHQKRDANGSAMIYGLSIQRDAFTKTCLFIRVDPAFLQTWWQLHEGGNLEHALGGWWNLPILDVGDQEAFIEAMVLDLIRRCARRPAVTGPGSETQRCGPVLLGPQSPVSRCAHSAMQ